MVNLLGSGGGFRLIALGLALQAVGFWQSPTRAVETRFDRIFTGPGDQAAFAADYRNRNNGLIYTANTRAAVGAAESSKMNFRHVDQADARRLNVILWEDAMGDKAIPAMLSQKQKRAKKDDDD